MLPCAGDARMRVATTAQEARKQVAGDTDRAAWQHERVFGRDAMVMTNIPGTLDYMFARVLSASAPLEALRSPA
jgi:hypothetical protein